MKVYTQTPWEARAIGSEGYAIGRKIDEDLLKLPVKEKLLAARRIGLIDGFDWETLRANAERIAACVNVCEGIPTEELIKMKVGGLHYAFEWYKINS